MVTATTPSRPVSESITRLTTESRADIRVVIVSHEGPLLPSVGRYALADTVSNGLANVTGRPDTNAETVACFDNCYVRPRPTTGIFE
jgi:hypothetical protein